MTDIKAALDRAAGEGIISSEQARQLLPLLSEPTSRGAPASPGETDAPPAGTSMSRSLSQPRESDPPNALEDSETPRFVRGFHDVLITIGVVVALAGLWGLGTIYASLPAIVILAEVLVRRQRLALPAVALVIAYIHWVARLSMKLFGLGQTSNLVLGGYLTANWMSICLIFAVFLAVFYWRYRVPLSLAAFIVSLFGALLAGIIDLAEMATGSQSLAIEHTVLGLAIMLIVALGMFAVAVGFDLKDPQRVKRWSDVAFWLHLLTAPLLFMSLVYLALYLIRQGSFGDAFEGYVRPLLVAVAVAVMMFIGLVIDRRAFVTSGLATLGVVIGGLLRQTHIALDQISFVALLIIGIVVLVIGISWLDLRRWLVRRLPAAMQARLPALR